MRLIILIIFIFCGIQKLNAQKTYADSLYQALATSKQDSTRLFILCHLSDYNSFLYPDSAMYYADKAIELSTNLKYTYGEALGLLCKGAAFDRVADFPAALQLAYNALETAKKLDTHKLYMMGMANNFIAHLNHMMGNSKKSIELYHNSISLVNQSGENPEEVYNTYFKLGFEMLMLGKNDSALFYINKGKRFLPFLKKYLRQPTPWLISANIYNATGNVDSADKYVREGLKISEEYNAVFLRAVLYNTLANVFLEKKKKDSCIYYVHQSLSISQKYHYKLFEIEGSGFLSDLYSDVNSDSTLKYLRIMLAAKDEAFSDSKQRQFQLIGFDDEKRQKELADTKMRFQNQVRMYALAGAVAVFLIIAFIFWRNNKQKQQANILLNEQKEKAENALAELKTTQAQLVQSEKMASLGELTAGIAHEIQNPLNFVNNFSEVNTELIEEMKTELEAGNKDEAIAIANDIKDNEQKINMHGKRADSIVKGMLQHSRTSTAQKELTDINALADECLRLSYHGFRSKEKSINLNFHTDFDKSAGKINIISQDIGRVILNLLNNAFYSVAEKKKTQPNDYEPVVSISTKRIIDKSDNHFVEIRIKDNGNGIPQSVLDKIFNPFFTTKPTGQGTGLGLSLSYDIITKGHAGELKVTTQEGEFAEFIITLPAPHEPQPDNNIHLS
ncbi:MAG: ATP-binding protein [Bacteroidota bacterium]